MSRIPDRTVHLADRFEHAAHLRPPSGDYLGVVEGKQTFVRHADSWQPCPKQDVMDAFFARGRIFFRAVAAPAPAPEPPAPKDKAQ